MNTYPELLKIAQSAVLWHCAPEKSADEIAEENFGAELALCKLLDIDVLGEWDSGAIELYSVYNRKVVRIRDIDKLGLARLIQICGPPAKRHVHNAMQQIDGMVRMGTVREAIAMLAGRKRLTHKSLLGIGCWRGFSDEGQPRDEVVMVGAGGGVSFNGKRTPEPIEHPRHGGLLLEFGGEEEDWFNPERLPGLFESAADPAWRNSVIDELSAEFGRWNWQSQDSTPELMAGLVLATVVQSVWEWRPQIVVTGESNAGKSYLFETLDRLFGGIAYKVSSRSTEAGIRQGIGNRSPAVLLDEWDKSPQRDRIFEMLRLAGRGDKRATGTRDQKGHESALQCMVWVAGIHSGMQEEADENRFIRVELIRPTRELRGKLRLRPVKELELLGQKAVAVAVASVIEAADLAADLKAEVRDGIHDRHIENYAVPAAMLAVANGGGREAAVKLLDVFTAAVIANGQEVERDEVAVLREVFEVQIGVNIDGFAYRSIGSLLDIEQNVHNGMNAARTSLNEAGILLTEFSGTDRGLTGEQCLAIAPSLLAKRMPARAGWTSRSISEILRRIDGADKSRRRFCGQVQPCIVLSLARINEMIGFLEVDHD